MRGELIESVHVIADPRKLATAAYLPAAAAEDMLRYLAEYVGRTAQMSPDLEVITGRSATAFTDWAVEHTASFR